MGFPPSSRGLFNREVREVTLNSEREGREDQKAKVAGERDEKIGVSTKQEISKSSATAPIDLNEND